MDEDKYFKSLVGLDGLKNPVSGDRHFKPGMIWNKAEEVKMISLSQQEI